MTLIHSKRIGALLAVLVLAAAGCGGSSSTTTTTVPGTIYGTVKKGTSVASGIAVSAAGLATTTASDGSYQLNVPPGTYSVRFTGDGVEAAQADGVSVAANQRVKVDQTLTASQLVVTVNLPESAAEGEPVGFGTTVSGITVTAKLNGATVSPDSVTWAIKDNTGLKDPPTAATASPASGATTSFDVGTFEEVVAGANTWMNNKYGETFPYIRPPERYELASFSAQQVLAMSYLVRATVKVGDRTTTGSALVSPVSVSNGGNYQPKGLMVVAGAPEADSYSWTLDYISPTATSPTFGAPPAGVTLNDATGRNPYFLPTVSGVYRLTNASNSIYLRVSTFHGVGKSASDAGTDGVACVSCHSGQYALGQFDEWINSAHGNHNYKDPFATSMPLVQFELSDTSPSNHYRESCLECHTVGYSKVPTADNDGFDDVARTNDPPWTFPTSYGPDAWASVANVPGLLHRASIQCENCHGPLAPEEHSQPEMNPAMFGMPLAPNASMSAGVCTVCHDEQPYHDRGSLWATSGHADPELVEEAFAENRGTSAAHCGRCHAAEGFLVYSAQQQAGTPGNIAKPTTCTASSNPYCSCSGDPAVCTVPAAATCTPRAGYTGSTDPYDPTCPCKPTAPATTCSGDPF